MANETDASNIDIAILFGETESLAQVGAHDIAVEHFYAQLAAAQLFLNDAG